MAKIKIEQTVGIVGINGTPVNNQLAVWVDGTFLEGESNLTYDGSLLTLTSSSLNFATVGSSLQFGGTSVLDNTSGIALQNIGSIDAITGAAIENSIDGGDIVIDLATRTTGNIDADRVDISQSATGGAVAGDDLILYEDISQGASGENRKQKVEVWRRDDVFKIYGTLDTSKILRFEVDGVATGTTRVITMPNQNIDLTPDTGSFVKASNATVSISDVTPATDTIPYFTGASTAAVTSFTPIARDLLDDTTPSAMRTTLQIDSDYRSEKKLIFLVAGQSNMVGFNDGPTNDIDDAPDPSILQVHRGNAGYSRRYPWLPNDEIGPAGNPLQNYTPSLQVDSVGLSYTFAKEIKRLYPQIESIILVPCARSNTGFSGSHWNPGDAHYEAVLTKLNTALNNNVDYSFGGILWHQGEYDAGTTVNADAYGAALAAMVADIRSRATDGANVPFILGTMLSTWIGADVDRLRVDEWHRNVDAYIPNSTFVDLSDLTNSYDSLHFDTDDLREAGRRYARNFQYLNWKQSQKDPNSIWIKVLDGEVVDLSGGAITPINVDVVTDGTRGDVLQVDTGDYIATSFQLAQSYTKALWVYRISNETNYEHFISGGGINAESHTFGINGYGHSNNYASNPDLETDVPITEWHHVALTHDGINFRYYLDGVFQSTTTTAAGSFEDKSVFINAYSTFANQGSNSYMDNVQVFNRVLSDDEIADLYAIQS
jgi:hypothetical protein